MSPAPDQQITHQSYLQPAPTEKLCRQCRRCISVCPLSLEPYRLWHAAIAINPRQCRQDDIAACLLCGCCQYACPEGLPLVEKILLAKRRIARG